MTTRIIILILLILLFLKKGTAQNINGDTILVSSDVQTWMSFQSVPNGQITKDARNFSVSGTGKSLVVLPLKTNTDPTTLIVQEGPRTHRFVIVYKADVSPLETTYNFSDLKQLEKEIKEKHTSVKSDPMPSTTTSSPKLNQDAIDFAIAISEGDEAFDKERYEDAKKAFQKSLTLKGNHEYAKTKLIEIDRKLAEREKIAQKLKDDNYNASVLKAAKAFTEKKYQDAQAAYKEALNFRPNDAFATNQITSINKTIADEAAKEKQNEAIRQQQETYKTTIANADKAFNAQQYQEAKSYYALAVSLNSTDSYPKKKLDETEKKIAATVNEKANKEREQSFQATVSKAKTAFDASDYEGAKKLYSDALSIKPGDKNVTNQLKAIDKAIASETEKENKGKQEKENENAFKAENYPVAITEYNTALRFKKDRRAEEQIKNINSIVSKRKESELSEKEKRDKEVLNSKNYDIAIKKAENLFSARDYANAKISYKQALNYKDEQGPKDKISEIDGILKDNAAKEKAQQEKAAEETEIDKKYNTAMSKAKALLAANDYVNAKQLYAEALSLKPSEIAPKTQMEIIDKKLAEAETIDKYDASISKGNLATADRQYTLALQSYKDALKLKPLETYPLKQINYIETLIANAAKDSVTAQKQAERQSATAAENKESLENFNGAMNAYKRGGVAVGERRYEDAFVEYQEFMRLIDTSKLNPNQFQRDVIEFAKKKIIDLKNYLIRIKGENYQLEAIPYTVDELRSKYPKLDFAVSPSDQVFDPADSAKENMQTSKELLAKPAAITVGDSSNHVNLTLQNIAKRGQFLYFKFRIQNHDNKEFFTGPMQLTADNKDKKIKKLNPVYITAFPIVLPGKEFFIVYVTNDYNVKDNGTLFFELSDRLKSNKIKVAFPGSILNGEKNHALAAH